ncbi:MAG: hypothetical protein HY035_07795 [Nitrospirae bacterium]|nr:hypothetical protein [Nitrospirota bacterium]
MSLSFPYLSPCGRVYGLLGDTYKAVEDIRKAARLGDKAAQNFLKMQKIEW